MTDRLSWDEARLCAYYAAAALPARSVPLDQALGGVLAEPLTAPVALPTADTSAMDGYAVRGAPPWRVVETADRSLEDGQACAVVTGAPVPKATDAVLPAEHAQRSGDLLRGRATPAAGMHVRPAGEECAAGDYLVATGTVAGPTVLGLAAALGHDTLRVHPTPAVRAVISGDELVDSGPPSPGRVRDAVGPMLPGLVAAAGGRWAGAVRVPDVPTVLRAALAQAHADVVLVTGASGQGPADHLRSVLAAAGAELLVDGVACRPGHPQTMARLPDGRLLVGLPGNPLAALVAFLTLAAAALAGLGGRELPELARLPAHDVRPHPTEHRIVPVRVRAGVARPVGYDGAAMLRGAAVADRLAVVSPADAASVRLLPDPGGSPWAS
ncbi:molybdopterin molybdotransferase MoeA [Pseudonocardia humida]|uniref:Molybdopterin molybdenumtransferase n=1 Tax=Pseudonocardia humida TaxID=2800819 RepID=A0ABT1ABC7_9PSEU|nr:molybdopterin molybdotransferase MoeA [Pseudonocardia humida]MCO1659944.1 molybdopterin molybdotransferase MoeA [Pseudonocardia humida]